MAAEGVGSAGSLWVERLEGAGVVARARGWWETTGLTAALVRSTVVRWRGGAEAREWLGLWKDDGIGLESGDSRGGWD